MKKSYILLAILLLLLPACESLFFYPEKTLRYHPDICEAKLVNTLFKSADGNMLHGWFVQSKTAQAKGTIMFFYGNGQNMSVHIHSILWLTEYGYNIFSFDYRGYGISVGDPTMKGVIDDGLSALEYLITGDIPNVGDVIILGQSMGAAVAIYTASETKFKERIKAVIIDSGFASWREIYRDKAGKIFLTWPFQYPISWFINDEYAPINYVSSVAKRYPLLIIHNKNDETVTIKHARQLYNATGHGAELLETDYTGHITAMNHDDIREHIINFLDNATM